MDIQQAAFLPVQFLPRKISVETRQDGTLIVKNGIPLQVGWKNIPSILRARAEAHPKKIWIAQRRGEARSWQTLDYGSALRQVDSLCQALLDLKQPGRAVMALSGNSLELAVLTLAAMQAGMPIAPVTPAYSLLSGDHSKLKEMASILKPAVIFAQDGAEFERPLSTLSAHNAHVICVTNPLSGGSTLGSLLEQPPRVDMESVVEQIGPESVGKYLFTSGSTGTPKAVVTTQAMMCSSLAMAAQIVEDADHRQLTLDWLPWSHVMGGSAQFNGVLEAGGSLYIDDGRPTPREFGETIRNLRELSPTNFANVPLGYAMLADVLEADHDLAERFFHRLKLLAYAGARLPDRLYERIQRVALRVRGHKIPFVSGYGATETAPTATYVFWPTDRVGMIGLPHPGVELKLVPWDEQRFEIRIRSAAVTPGYLNSPEATAAAFDEEGFYRMGDAASFVDPEDVNEGFLFAGRLTEDFKLQSGVFVDTGRLRMAIMDACSPLISDAVIAGADREFVAALVWPALAPCRAFLQDETATLAEIAHSTKLRAAIQVALMEYNAGHPGTASRIGRAMLLSMPPAFDAGEVTAKGYVNQRRVLEQRASEVARLYAEAPDPDVILLKQSEVTP